MLTSNSHPGVMPASAPPIVRPEIVTVLAVPTFLVSNVLVALVTMDQRRTPTGQVRTEIVIHQVLDHQHG